MARQPNIPPGYFKLRNRLPTQHYAAIGRIITRWAIIEYKLAHLAFIALDMTQEAGRLTLRSQRAQERALLIQDLLRLKKVSAGINWRELSKTLKEMGSFRDRLAHSVWVKHPGSDDPVLQDLSTAYIHDLPAGHRAKIEPIAVGIPLKNLNILSRNMDGLIKALTDMEGMMRHALGSSSEKSE